ncbi:MAG: hypothetical protein D9C04_06050 [Nitrosopumilus sp. B06]|nr:MAG: hypothetical protein D9C04_06050 [Nitrosopumilus sp. B06]
MYGHETAHVIQSHEPFLVSYLILALNLWMQGILGAFWAPGERMVLDCLKLCNCEILRYMDWFLRALSGYFWDYA